MRTVKLLQSTGTYLEHGDVSGATDAGGLVAGAAAVPKVVELNKMGKKKKREKRDPSLYLL